jgi:hypothetical protein
MEPTQVVHLTVPHFMGLFLALLTNVRLAMEKLARDRHSRLAPSSVTKKNVLCNWQQVYADELESILEVSVSLIKMPFFAVDAVEK